MTASLNLVGHVHYKRDSSDGLCSGSVQRSDGDAVGKN
jgi:hypothetical protein